MPLITHITEVCLHVTYLVPRHISSSILLALELLLSLTIAGVVYSRSFLLHRFLLSCVHHIDNVLTQ